MNAKRNDGLPVFAETDVLVAGGGPAGLSAGFAAAKQGARTLIIEQFNCLGGIATAGGHGHVCLYSSWGDRTRVVGGPIYDMGVRCAEIGYGVINNSNADFEVEGMKLALEMMAEETGVKLLYHTFYCDTIVEDGRAVGAIVQNKNGRGIIKAKRIIDATGDGDAAARAGCDFDIGDEETGLCQPMTLMFTIGGVDYEKVIAFKKTLGHENREFQSVWKKAQDAGDMRPFQSRIMGWWHTPTRPDFVGVNFTHITRVSAIDAWDLTRATIEGRKQAYESIDVYRKYVPGMENCYMVSTPNVIGTRESRRIKGKYTITKEDVMGRASFDDSIGYGSFFIDIHNTEGIGMDKKTWRPDVGFRYQIPYRIMVPKTVDNILVAGRCVSASHEALGSLRVMPQCGVMGHAAGLAAVLSIKKDVSPANVDIKELQSSIRSDGGIVDEGDVKRVNG